MLSSAQVPAATFDHSKSSSWHASFLTVSTGVETPHRIAAAAATRDGPHTAPAPCDPQISSGPLISAPSQESGPPIQGAITYEEGVVALPVNSQVFIDEMSSLQQFGPQGSAPMFMTPECKRIVINVCAEPS